MLVQIVVIKLEGSTALPSTVRVIAIEAILEVNKQFRVAYVMNLAGKIKGCMQPPSSESPMPDKLRLEWPGLRMNLLITFEHISAELCR